MKIAFIVAIAVMVLGGCAILLLVSERKAIAQTARKTEQQTFFCDRLAISPEHRKRHEELSKILGSARLGVRDADGGFEFEFPGDPATYQAVMEWIPDERACCPFFDITVRLEREQGKIWLGFSGIEGVKPFIKAEFAAWFRP